MLLNSVLLLGLASCGSAYKGLQRTDADAASCLEKFRPKIDSPALYSTQVDILQHHLSGLLYFRPMDNGSMRVLFMSEMGMKFFDFEFTKDGSFIKHYLLPKMDKKAVVKTLRKDFDMVLMRRDPSTAQTFTGNGLRYTAFDLPKGKIYYITDTACSELVRVENGSRRKPVVDVWLKQYRNGVPDSIDIRHHTVKFNISLQRVEK
ncbi:hypothetical protein [Chitinophaga rhizosphaerae]|uniref:hypothetical protein n=1 Tax=Chitinophaga rhizosphaerae TaxID=1864947 RepID=UPI000F7FAEF9|nr:hypothetical protein [Chitinophaga rhizosphaerae]